MASDTASAFSTRWLVVSIVTFIAMELALGWFVGAVLVGKYVSEMCHLRMQ